VLYLIAPFFSTLFLFLLSCSRTFQRFAIRSNAMFSEAAKKGVEKHAEVSSQGAEFFKVFREEVSYIPPPYMLSIS
jgi:hypothetical protein